MSITRRIELAICRQENGAGDGPVFFPDMLFTNVPVCFCRFLVPNSHIVTRIVTGTLPGGEFRIEAEEEREFPELPREWKAASPSSVFLNRILNPALLGLCFRNHHRQNSRQWRAVASFLFEYSIAPQHSTSSKDRALVMNR